MKEVRSDLHVMAARLASERREVRTSLTKDESEQSAYRASEATNAGTQILLNAKPEGSLAAGVRKPLPQA
jgi:hypothetical protein